MPYYSSKRKRVVKDDVSRPVRGRRTYNKRRVPRNLSSNVFTFQRTFTLSNWTPGTAATADFWKKYVFTLNQMSDSSDVTNLFDMYKITKIKTTFRPRYDGFDGSNTTDVTLPNITNQGKVYAHVINDPDDDTIPSGTYTRANMNTFMTLGDVKSYDGSRPFSVYTYPKIDSAFGGNLLTGRTPSRYLLTSASGISHYGFHIFLQDINQTGTFNQSYDVFVTFYLSCKSVK